MKKIDCDVLAIVHRLWIDDKRRKGGLDMILDYWVDHGLRVCLVEHPLEGNFSTVITVREEGRPVEKVFNARVTSFTGPIQWVGEAIFNIWFILTKVCGRPLLATSDLLNNVSGVLLKKKFRKFYFHSVDYSLNRFDNQILNWIYAILLKASFRFADLIGVVSSRTRDDMQKRGCSGSKIFYVPNSPYYESFDYQCVRESEKTPLSIVYTSTNILPLYCYEDVVEVLKYVKKSFPNVLLYALGGKNKDEKYFQRIMSKIKECSLEANIEFTGYLRKEEINAFLRRAKVGIAFHSQERFFYAYFGDSLKIREYAAFGLPTITDGNSSTADDLEKAGAGFVTNGAKDAALRTIELFGDEKQYNSISSNAIKWARGNDKKRLLGELSERLNLLG